MAIVKDHTVSAKLGKRKRDTIEQFNGKPKLQEYLQVMQPPSKSKIWSNEDVTRPQGASHPIIGSPRQVAIEEYDDRDYDNVLKKSKDVVRPDQFKESLFSLEGISSTVPPVTQQEDEISEEPSLLLNQQLSVASDGDWLRSRTGNLVESDGTGDAIPPKTFPGTDEVLVKESITTHQLPRSIMSDIGIQAEPESESRVSGPTLDSINAADRVFVRNLAYTCTEDELREFFTSQELGSIQEVISNFCFPVFTGKFYDEHPDRDNLY